MLRVIRLNTVKRFSHTDKTVFPENKNKVLEDLIRKQNEQLAYININISVIGILITILTAVTSVHVRYIIYPL